MRHNQGIEIHGSTGAPLPEKNHGRQKKIEAEKKWEKPDKKIWILKIYLEENQTK